MKTIPLTKGLVALVSDEDFEFLNKWSWFASDCNGTTYAATFDKERYVSDKVVTQKRMHKVVATRMGLSGHIDHEDRNGLNNQRYNLRAATRTQNNANSGIRSDNTSGYRGVTWLNREQKWRASLQYKGKTISLGNHDSLIAAVKRYNRAATMYFGKFATLNPIPEEDK